MRKRVSLILALSILFTLAGFICNLFLTDFRTYLNDSHKESVQETLDLRTQQKIRFINQTIKNKFTELESLSQIVVGQDILLAPQQRLDILNQFIKKDHANAIDIFLPEQNTKNKYASKEVEYAVQTALSGKNSISDIYYLAENQTAFISFAVPIYRNQKIIGALYATYPALILSAALDGAATDDLEQSLLTTSTGKTIATTLNQSTLADWQTNMSTAHFLDKSSLLSIKEDLSNQKQGITRYHLNEKDFYLQYVPLGIHHWYLLNILPLNIIDKQYTRLTDQAVIFCLKILIFTFALFFIAYIYILKQNRQAYRSKKDLEILTNNVNCSVVLMIYDEYLTLKYANDAYYKMFGLPLYEKDPDTSHRLLQHIFSPDRVKLRQQADQQISAGTTLELEFRIRTKKNQISWLLLKGHQTFNHSTPDSKAPIFNCVIVDITAMKQTSRELETLTNSIPGGVAKIFIGSNVSLLYANDGYYNLVGYTREEYVDLGKRPLSKVIHPEDLDRTISYLRAYAYQRQSINIEYRIVHKDKSVSWVLMRGNRIEENMITPVFQCVFIDITLNKELQKSLELESERYRILADFSDDILFEFDSKKQIMTFSKKYEALTGLNPAMHDFRETAVKYQLIYEEDIDRFLDFYDAFKNGNHDSAEIELRLNTRTGYIWCKVQAVTLFGDNHVAKSVIGKIVNIDIQKQETARLRALAQKDLLTQLFNHNTTISLIQNYLKNSAITDLHALIVIDIDDFKSINDTLGHLAGDKVLRLLSEQLTTLFRSSDVIGRIGGDEFVVFLRDIPTHDFIIEKAKAICEIFESIHLEENSNYKISGSIGISLYPQDGMEYDVLFSKADSTLYFAKRRGKDCYAFFGDHVSRHIECHSSSKFF